jgi:hypothetical protein
MTMISPIRYEVEIQEPLSTPVPMPPSMSSSDALVIWMLSTAMKAPIIAAITEIQVARLARCSPPAAEFWTALSAIVVSAGASDYLASPAATRPTGEFVSMVGVTDMPGRSFPSSGP